ncbi:hypothetical protein [Paenibacillus odorifer]|uniref:hypothetical protein n=1 Tax=Paenibacillus odorifer TaxID=189426 RepID=UPI00096CBA7E|nr:hypothetical protein [Paenibacillus odorifer]OMD66891.1 hypothetical protein BSK50_30405 [Paenibacillus odorifer]
MSLNAIHCSTIIFSDTQTKAEDKMKELVSSLPSSDILLTTNNYVKTKIGTFHALKYSKGCRGYRYQNVYIDKILALDLEATDLIMMKLVSPNYYGETQATEYSLKEHVHYF